MLTGCSAPFVWRSCELWLFSEFGAVYKYSDLLTYLLTSTSSSSSYVRRRLLCFLYVPLSRCPVPAWVVLLLRTNTERISMKFAGRRPKPNHCHQQMNWLHVWRNCIRDDGAGYDRKFESTSNRCCQLANAETSYDRERSLHIDLQLLLLLLTLLQANKDRYSYLKPSCGITFTLHDQSPRHNER